MPPQYSHFRQCQFLLDSISRFFSWWLGGFFSPCFRTLKSPVEGAVLNKFSKLKSKRFAISQAGGLRYPWETPSIRGMVAYSEAWNQNKTFARRYLGFSGLPGAEHLASISRTWLWLNMTVATIRQACRLHGQTPPGSSVVRERHSSTHPGLRHQAELLMPTVSRDIFVREPIM